MLVAMLVSFRGHVKHCTVYCFFFKLYCMLEYNRSKLDYFFLKILYSSGSILVCVHSVRVT